MAQHSLMYVNSYDRGAPRPKLGSYWLWKDGSRTKVVEVKWNGEEWWVRTVLYDPPDSDPRWNDLNIFWDQAEPWGPPHGLG